MLVSQSYNIFNRFGKDSTALDDITRAFIEDLSEFHDSEITAAFKSYRKSNGGMPVPANIRDEIIKNRSEKTKDNRLKSYSEFGGDWVRYKNYLADNDILSDNFVKGMSRGENTYVLKNGYVPQWKHKDF